MKRLRNKSLILTLLLVGLSALQGLASTVKNLDINVRLQSNGYAYIVEKWDIELEDDAKTEWYVKHTAQTGMAITNLKVSGYIPGEEGLQPFETLDTWNLDASREEKTGKCGINNGEEICWGFGDHGRHQYVVSYVITNLIKSYDTNDGFNHCFVDMDCDIENASITISGEDTILLSEGNTRRWAFGYEGPINFEGNSIVTSVDGELSSDNRMIVMLEFDKGLFHPSLKADETWEARKQRALDGSDFESEDWTWFDWCMLIVVLLAALFFGFLIQFMGTIFYYLMLGSLYVAWWVLSLSPLRTYLKRKRLGIRKDRYFREVKKEWSLVKNKSVINKMSYFGDMDNKRIFGALLIRLIAKGDVSVIKADYKGKKKDMLKIERPVTEINDTLKNDEYLSERMLRILTLASGKDLILQPNEFKSWAKKNKSAVSSIMKKLEGEADKKYVERNAADLFGMKYFLKDFSLLNERGMMDVVLWDSYMVYAEFFGIADKVMDEMKKICPEYLNMSTLAKNIEVADEDFTYMWTDSMYTVVSDVVESLKNKNDAAGFGSWSSFGGGGGSSGGGGGGGR
ncbi:MAG: DUF2207 domain-containing protein [Bacteroidaceae bacterium]|nr:DUF2207 domain-containing protein [Bacteroidaceae bacterium]